ncbi:MAG: DNA translocase FtsK [Phycisphaerae bacterium]|nr:DNA translocase FtsK [Phycisphaerae bacterium]
MPRSKTSRSPLRSSPTGTDPDDRRFEPTIVRRALWLVGLAAWLFLAVAVVGADWADAPSSVVSVHHAEVQNPAGPVGASLAWWTFRVFGPGTWLLLAMGVLALVTLARGITIPHPFVRAVGAVLAAVTLAGLHHGMVASSETLAPLAGGIPGLPSGLIGAELELGLGSRFGPVGSTLIMLLGFGLGLLVAADEIVLAIPSAMIRSVRSIRGMATGGSGVIGPVASMIATARRSIRRPSLQPAGVPADYLDYEEEDEEEDDEDDYEYEDEYEEDGEEDEEEDEDEYEYEDEYEEEEEEEEEEEPAAPRRAASAEELREKISKLPVRMAASTNLIAKDEDIPREDDFEGYQFPTLDQLEDPGGDFSAELEDIVRGQAGLLEETLRTFSIDAEVAGIESGPAVTLYSVLLAPGTRVARLNAIEKDIARSLQAPNIRIIPNMAGKSTVGIEVPNAKREKVRLKELMSTGLSRDMVLPMFLGKDSAGDPMVADLTKMPHMLIAGTTGSGKSVCMNTIIMSWLYTKRPDELKLCLVDPKMVEMSQFEKIPHLMCPVVTDMGKAAAILEWAVGKMEERYELFKEAGVRDIRSYNSLEDDELREIFQPANDVEWAKIPKKIPYMVFVIDELADLMMTNKEVEHAIVRIAQKARAVGMHLILATQRPQANVVTGLIKSNMPCRVSFKVASGMDSRIVLDSKGAELLLGLGDMMVVTPSSTEVSRGQGTLVTDKEVRQVATFLKSVAGPSFERSLMSVRPSSQGGGDADPEERDALFDQAVEIIIETGRGSVSLLQRRLAIGYSRASRLVDQMGMAGIISDHKGSVARDVLISMEDWEQMKRLEAGLEASDAVEDLDGDEGVPDEIEGEYRH